MHLIPVLRSQKHKKLENAGAIKKRCEKQYFHLKKQYTKRTEGGKSDVSQKSVSDGCQRLVRDVRKI